MPDLFFLLAELTSGDDVRAENAIQPLVAMGNAAVPALLDLCSSEDEDIRWWALRTLAQFENTDVEWFLPALDDESPSVRECAALALCHHPHPEAGPRLIEALEDPDSLVANLAGNALISLGAQVTPALVHTLENGSPAARIEAARALSEIRDPQSIPTLMKALESDSAMIQYWSEQGLEKLGLGMIYFKPE